MVFPYLEHARKLSFIVIIKPIEGYTSTSHRCTSLLDFILFLPCWKLYPYMVPKMRIMHISLWPTLVRKWDITFLPLCRRIFAYGPYLICVSFLDSSLYMISIIELLVRLGVSEWEFDLGFEMEKIPFWFQVESSFEYAFSYMVSGHFLELW